MESWLQFSDQFWRAWEGLGNLCPWRASVTRQKELISSDKGKKSSSAISPSLFWANGSWCAETSYIFTLVVFSDHNCVIMLQAAEANCMEWKKYKHVSRGHANEFLLTFLLMHQMSQQAFTRTQWMPKVCILYFGSPKQGTETLNRTRTFEQAAHTAYVFLQLWFFVTGIICNKINNQWTYLRDDKRISECLVVVVLLQALLFPSVECVKGVHPFLTSQEPAAYVCVQCVITDRIMSAQFQTCWPAAGFGK